MARLLDILMSNGVTLADLGSLRIARGETLIRQNAPSDAIYFVLAGRFRVERDGATIGTIEPGSVVGDIGFFTGAARTASVVAFRDSLVLRLTREDYDSLCARHPGFRDGIIAELASRFAERFQTPDIARRERTRPRTIALIGAADRLLPARIADRLANAVAALVPAQAVSRATFRAAMPGAAPDSLEAVDWFSRTEREREVTLYLPEPGDDDWQQAIVRQADQVLILGEAGTPPPLAPIERFALAQIPRDQRRLVLLHPRRHTVVAGTAAWLDARRVAMHHHVALTGTSDIRRLARFLTGNAVGLVLSGGGAYGVAHIGTYQALTGVGLGFDIFGGTSVGSAMGAAFALGIAGEELTRRTTDIFLTSRALRRVTLPRYALLDHKVFDAKLAEHFGTLDVADMWLPFYAVAANLGTNSAEIIRQGPLWQAIRASSALPGILPPFIRPDGALLVDGGILDNLPYRAMHDIKAGPNVVVSLARARPPERGWAYDRIPGRAGLLLAMLHPRGWRASPAPGVTETIIRSMMAGQSSRPETPGPRDWRITPPLSEQMGFMNWKDAFDLIAPAERHARQGWAALEVENKALHGALLAAAPPRRR
ncbi:patatin-like phospholipase family protein [Seohaeicola zhoushanensis]|uniref:Cyclic nucleotide-binding domain-containing protein n=1 Tax=Seohaeicola zhoushanensis TaxID=1569283 RepID=A0A8J3GV08_9RHOB|nr:patatin-like phospholipase family protein [Seohaeicola zhoushanensis]GHF37345.1 hypothetical protein GCM10017056_06550 [Seohaeicola zhoushanensis]